MPTKEVDDLTSKADFTEEEWTQVKVLPVMAIAGAVFADGRKLITSVSESIAGFGAYKVAAAKYPDNPLLQEFVSSEEAGIAKPAIPKEATVSDAVAAVTAEVQKAVDVARPKVSATEWEQISEVLMAAATAAAARKGSGTMGFGGEMIQAEEQEYLDQLSAILTGSGSAATADGDDA